MKIYLASPYGFAQCMQEFKDQLVNKLVKEGYAVYDPWNSSEGSTAKNLGKLNQIAIKDCDVVVACCDGSGIEIDSGVAAEIGYAYGIGKIIIAYREDVRKIIEGPFEGFINLQVMFFVLDSKGGNLVVSIDQLMRRLKLLKDHHRG